MGSISTVRKEGAPEGHEHLEAAAEDDEFYRWCKEDADISIASHQHHDCRVFFVCAAEANFSAYRGDPTEIPTVALGNDTQRAAWDAKIKAFCEVYNIPYQQPKWWLASYWG